MNCAHGMAMVEKCAVCSDPDVIALRHAAEPALYELQSFLEEAGDCEHDVNHCVCSAKHAADNLWAALGGLPPTQKGSGER